MQKQHRCKQIDIVVSKTRCYIYYTMNNQYIIIQDILKDLRKEVEIAIKTKEANSQLEPTRNSYSTDLCNITLACEQ